MSLNTSESCGRAREVLLIVAEIINSIFLTHLKTHQFPHVASFCSFFSMLILQLQYGTNFALFTFQYLFKIVGPIVQNIGYDFKVTGDDQPGGNERKALCSFN